MKNEEEIGKLITVSHDVATDKVFVTFEVIDENYKDLAFRFAKRKDIQLIIRGDKLTATKTEWIMPLYDFSCQDCEFQKEHFITNGSTKQLKCPKCQSEKYQRLLPIFSVNIEYGSVKDTVAHKVDPFVKEMHEKIGREATNFDTKTLDNLFGADRVKSTFYEKDDWRISIQMYFNMEDLCLTLFTLN